MNYIPVSEIEKLRNRFRRHKQEAKTGAGELIYGNVLNALDHFIEFAATEGVTIEGFTVDVDIVAGSGWVARMSNDDGSALAQYDLRTGTLIFIPDKTVVTEGEK